MNQPAGAIGENMTDVETPGRHFVDDYLPAMLAQASHLISSEFHVVARAHGYSVSEWRVVATLEGGAPMSIGRLAQIAILKQPTVTRILDRMAADGIVERISHASDRRVTLVRITARGKRGVKQLKKLALEHEQRVLEPFGDASVATLKRMLRRMIELREVSFEEPESVES